MSRHLEPSPAAARLEWILDGIAGTDGWGGDVHEVLAPGLAAVVPPDTYRERVDERARAYAPLIVLAIETDPERHTARARLRRPDGAIDVLSCTVEESPPHRIVSTWVAGWVPDGLGPRLPLDFGEDAPMVPVGVTSAAEDVPDRAGAPLLAVFSGVPCSGKSTVAEAAGAALDVPVFAIDWLLGALTPFGGRHLDRLWDCGQELLTTLAVRQLVAGGSAILDAPAEDEATRHRWRTLAARYRARFAVVHCHCPDPDEHRRRAEDTSRSIPGWHAARNWDDIARRAAAFPPWSDTDDVLTVDTTEPHRRNVDDVVDFLSQARG